ncbi:MAG: TlpA family protein disulfide reductase [Bryobacteraceae bacterium]
MQTRSDYLLAALLLASASLNLFQLHQLQSVRAHEELQPGVAVPPITASTLDGRRTVIPVSGELPTMLYVFSPQCGWCERNHASVVRLETLLRGRYRFAGISLSESGLREYLAARPFPFPVYQNPSVEALMAYRMGSTPRTIFLSKDGKIERAWNGAFVDDLKKEIEEFLKVKDL